MISGLEIFEQVQNGKITIEPFDYKSCGPNSYDIRLGPEMLRVQSNCLSHIDTRKKSETMPNDLVDGYFILHPNEVYLGSSVEYFGSDKFVPTIHGRSSCARHGLMVHLSAGFADCGWYGNLVFELVNMTQYPMMVYAGDRIAQIAFERVEGNIELYKSTYQWQRGIVCAKSLAD